MLRIKEILKEKGVSGKSLADQLGITENSLSLIVNEKRQPRYETLIDIAKKLDVDIKDLFNSTKASETIELFSKKEDGSFERFGTLVK